MQMQTRYDEREDAKKEEGEKNDEEKEWKKER